MRVFVIVRELISCFIAEGHYIACPTHGLYARDAAAGYDTDKRRTDAWALDCRIRAAVETEDLIEAWARDLGKLRRAEMRRQGMKLQDAVFFLYPFVESTEIQDSDEGPFRSACGKYGAYVATAARGIVRYAKLQHEIRLREEGGADDPSDGPAGSKGA
eukprot:913621-Pyramimonas_sp.AAC.1